MKKFSAVLVSLAASSFLFAQDPPLPEGLGGKAGKAGKERAEESEQASETNAEEPALPGGLPSEPVLPGGLSSEPSLPGGLSSEPSLPGGLTGATPALPEGLGGGTTATEDASKDASGNTSKNTWFQDSIPFGMTGFIESRLGTRTQDDATQRDTTIGELRAQLEYEKDLESVQFSISADLIYDSVAEDQSIELDTGQGWMDLRQASFLLRPTNNSDLEVGRQILTWGTGDLLFINDLFPKDWNSFFIGRDDEYLKAPSDAAKLSLFNDTVNLDIIYTPRFNSDRFIDGTRLSYFDPAQGTVVGSESPLSVDTRNKWFSEDEIAVRAYRNLGVWEAALYGYTGYWKSPGGQDATTGFATFPRLAVWGASLRGPMSGGIASFETGYYDSRDDSAGDDPYINNAEFRFLAAYEKEILPQLTFGLQYYLEQLRDYSAYIQTLPESITAREEHRHVFTARLTRLAMNQNLTLSLFNYYSPSDEDGYLRGKANYKLNDQWQIEAGGNFFYGEDRHTFFAQFEDNSNVFVGARFSF